MKTEEFCEKYHACKEGLSWALSISDEMHDVWEAMIAHEKYEWLLWVGTRVYVFPESSLRLMACRFVRETPLANGGTVWNLLDNDRIRKTVIVAERFAKGDASKDELKLAFKTAKLDSRTPKTAQVILMYNAAANTAYVSDYYTYDAAYAIANDTSNAICDNVFLSDYLSARTTQGKIVSEFGNPFKRCE
jgi:hypothetical protein